MRTRALLASLATVTSLASGCGSGGTPHTSDSSPSAQQSSGMPDGHESGHDISADEMAAMSGPSKAAAMICSDEIQTVVQQTFDLARRPTPIRVWSANGLRLACSYRLPGGTVRMTVQDAPDERTGRPSFKRLRAKLPGATRIRGVQNLGFPAYETSNGSVIFLKDGKTLRADASDLDRDGLPAGFSKDEAAYAVAAAVIACWTE